MLDRQPFTAELHSHCFVDVIVSIDVRSDTPFGGTKIKKRRGIEKRTNNAYQRNGKLRQVWDDSVLINPLERQIYYFTSTAML